MGDIIYSVAILILPVGIILAGHCLGLWTITWKGKRLF